MHHVTVFVVCVKLESCCAWQALHIPIPATVTVAIPTMATLQMTVSSPLMDQKLIQVFHVKISMPTVENRMPSIGSG